MNYSSVLGAEPTQVVEPTTVQEVADAVQHAREAGGAVFPWGAGTAQSYGYMPSCSGTVLYLSSLNRIIEHQPGDLVITVEAGATLAQVQEALALHNQYLPLDPVHSSVATIGGIIATDAQGLSRVGAGTVRDWLIGLTVVDGWGRIVKGGGKVVKNVTGYDLPKLHVGALGTLGIIVEATFKVAPLPDGARPLLLAGGGETLVTRIHAETAPAMSQLRMISGGSEVLALLYSGRQEVVDQQLQRAVTIAQESGGGPTRLPPGMPMPLTDTPPDSMLVVRVSGPPAETYRRHRQLEELALWRLIDSEPGVGVTDVHLRTGDATQTLELLLTWAEHINASVAVQHAPRELRMGSLPLWYPLPPALPLMRRLKETLDPDTILNPGRFVGQL